MKKRRRLLGVALSLVLLALSLLPMGCMKIERQFKRSEPDLAQGAKIYLDGNETDVRAFGGEEAHALELRFASQVTFNTVVISEDDKNRVTDAEIYADGELVWKQDEVGQIRVAYLGMRSATSLIVKVNAFEGKYRIENVEVYDAPRNREDYRVFDYFLTGANGERLERYTDEHWEGVKHVTDLILFDGEAFSFDEKGAVHYNAELAKATIARLRALNPALRIHVNLLPLSSDASINAKEWPKNIIAIHDGAFRSECFIPEINAMIADLGLDGVGFDYEYPETIGQCNRYGKFLKKLKKALPAGKELVCAVASYKLPIPQAAWDAMDFILVMTYDQCGRGACHSTWQNAVIDAINIALNSGIPAEKLTLGLPFYSRPTILNATKTTQIPYWGSYCDDAYRMSPFTNELFVNSVYDIYGDVFVESLYYNGPQMIADKSAFAYDAGLAGVFIWNYDCDLPYNDPMSLLSALNHAI